VRTEALREYCLSFPQAAEKLQWGDNLCFKASGKIFAILGLDSVPQRLCLKCAPEKFEELLEVEGIRPAPYLGRYKWVLLEGLDVLPAAEVRGLIAASYHMVSAKAKRPRKPLRKQKKPGSKTRKRKP
jgi:predicted DNA-binding protein (MmcQ/YjbR family)